MPTVVLSPEKFREEAARRLIDRFELQNLLGIRSRSAIARMVDDGRLPAPVVTKDSQKRDGEAVSYLMLWDRDEVLALTDK